jgi:hypothetical protein
MRKAVIPAFLLVLGSVVVGATVLREPIANAASPFTNVIIGNTSTNPVPVSEQNIDASGNVRVHEQGTAAVHEQGTAAVHEQGTAEVHVANGSIPITGTVSVANSNLRVLSVAHDHTIPANTAHLFGWVDTSDCRALAAFLDPGPIDASTFSVSLELSVTGGRIGDSLGSVTGERPGGYGVWYFNSNKGHPFFSPKSEVEISNLDRDNAHTISDLYLICQH